MRVSEEFRLLYFLLIGLVVALRDGSLKRKVNVVHLISICSSTTTKERGQSASCTRLMDRRQSIVDNSRSHARRMLDLWAHLLAPHRSALQNYSSLRASLKKERCGAFFSDRGREHRASCAESMCGGACASKLSLVVSTSIQGDQEPLSIQLSARAHA